MTFMRAVEYLRAKPACWCSPLCSRPVAPRRSPSAATNISQTNRPAQWSGLRPENRLPTDTPPFRQCPNPLPARRADLPTAFTLNAPISLADLRSIERHVKALAARVSPAVVAVEVGNGSGSGVVISADGLVLTAGHVCGGPDRNVRFTFPDGKTARGKTLGGTTRATPGSCGSPTGAPGPMRPWVIWRRRGSETGCWRWAIPGALTCGDRWWCGWGASSGSTPGALQTDCTISPGDSGGPLLDMHGRVIGIHSAISTSLAENFHVAVTEFYDNWDLLAKGDQRRRTGLGAPGLCRGQRRE